MHAATAVQTGARPEDSRLPTRPILPLETDEHGDTFHVWLVKRSFTLLAPTCKLGLVAALLFLCVVDPLYYFSDLWTSTVPLVYLVSWHAAITLFLGSFLLIGLRAHSHTARAHTLLVFFCIQALLFVWFGVVSWLATGDLSMFAIAQLLLAAVFFFPGPVRRWINGVQALTLALILAWLDTSGKFLGLMNLVNLVVVVGVAYVIDGYMLNNARALFAQQCRLVRELKRADKVLYNALPLHIAEELKVHHSVKAQSYPAMSILFADIVGFTQFSAGRNPDQVLRILNELFSEMDELVGAHQVEKIKTIGDAYMAVSKDNPGALARLALSMRDLIRRYNEVRGFAFSLRIGMHCGSTIAGVIGQKRFLYDVWSDAVNLASRLESMGEPDRIHTSEAIFALLQHGFEFEERGLLDIKGKGPLRTYYLLGEKRTDAP
jgi:class 3 adenylate cyclase